MSAEIQVRVNGKSYQTLVEPRLLLVHYLRDILTSPARMSGVRPPFVALAPFCSMARPSSHATVLAGRHRAPKSQPSKAYPLWAPRTAMACIQCRRDSGKNMDCNAAFARRE